MPHYTPTAFPRQVWRTRVPRLVSGLRLQIRSRAAHPAGARNRLWLVLRAGLSGRGVRPLSIFQGHPPVLPAKTGPLSACPAPAVKTIPQFNPWIYSVDVIIPSDRVRPEIGMDANERRGASNCRFSGAWGPSGEFCILRATGRNRARLGRRPPVAFIRIGPDRQGVMRWTSGAKARLDRDRVNNHFNSSLERRIELMEPKAETPGQWQLGRLLPLTITRTSVCLSWPPVRATHGFIDPFDLPPPNDRYLRIAVANGVGCERALSAPLRHPGPGANR